MYEFTELFVYKFVFIAELLIAMHLYSFRRKHRSRFTLRVILGTLICFGIGFAYPVAVYSEWYSSLMFLVLFTVCSVVHYFLYDIPVKLLFFLCVSAYTTQHFAHELYTLLANAVGLVSNATMGMYGSAPIGNNFASPRIILVSSVYLEVYLVSYWVLYILFGKKINREDVRINNFAIALIAALILLIDIVMNAVAVYIPNGYSKTYTFLTCIYNLICCLLILYIQVSLCVQKKLERELETVSLLLHQSEQQFKERQENIDLLNLKCHDLKHQIREYGGKRKIAEEYIQDIENIVNIYDSSVKTGNDALDLILTEKSLLCQKMEISLTCLADCTKLGFVTDTDLYGLFGNIVDNAMEAVMKIDEKERRNINVIVKNINDFVYIEVTNYYTGELKLDEEGIPVTTKDTNYHGYGFKSVRKIIEKYGGDLTISTSGEIFSLSILLRMTETAEN